MLLMPGEMPKNCVIDCPCWNEYSIDECQLGAVDHNGIDPVKGRLRDCPLRKAPSMEMAINGMSKAILALAESVTDNDQINLDIFLEELKGKIDIQRMNQKKEERN